MNKYGIYIKFEMVYGMDASWETYTNDYYNNETSKEQIIKCINDNIDYLSKFIKPSILLDFTRTLSVANAGNKLYDNLCENLSYIESLEKKASGISPDLYIKFIDFVFGESTPFNKKERCHLMLFPHKNINNMSMLLYESDRFNDYFKAFLSEDKTLFQILINDADAGEISKADVICKLKINLNSVMYHEREINANIESMKVQLGRLSPSVALSEDEKKVIEEAKVKVN